MLKYKKLKKISGRIPITKVPKIKGTNTTNSRRFTSKNLFVY